MMDNSIGVSVQNSWHKEGGILVSGREWLWGNIQAVASSGRIG